MLAQPDGALSGRPLQEVLVAGVEQVLAVFREETPARFQARMLKADGRLVEVSVAVDPTLRGGHSSSVTVVCKPIPPWTSMAPPKPIE